MQHLLEVSNFCTFKVTPLTFITCLNTHTCAFGFEFLVYLSQFKSFLPPLEFLAITIISGMDGYHGKQGFKFGAIPPHPKIIGGSGGWPFLPSFPLFESNEELEESLGGSLPLPPTRKCFMECIFESTPQLVPWEMDCRNSPFCLSLGPTLLALLKFAFFVVVTSCLIFEGRQQLEIMVPESLAFQGTWLTPFHTSRVPILDLQWWKVNQPMAFGMLEELTHEVPSWVWVVSFGLPKWAPLSSSYLFSSSLKYNSCPCLFQNHQFNFSSWVPLYHPKSKDGNDILLFNALPPRTICTMMVSLCPYTPPLLLGGSNYPLFIIGITHKLRRLGHVRIIGSFLARVSNNYTFI